MLFFLEEGDRGDDASFFARISDLTAGLVQCSCKRNKLDNGIKIVCVLLLEPNYYVVRCSVIK